MPSHLHEALLELFRHRPSLAADLLSGALGVNLPAYEHARLEAGDLTDVSPTEYRADAVVVLTVGTGAALAVVVEAQLRPDRRKRWSWPVYLTTLAARLRCPVMLLVMCPSTATAEWCAEPIKLGHPGWVLRPLVLGPERVPLVTDLDEAARAPELVVLSAMAHGATHPDRDKIFHALLTTLTKVDDAQAPRYHDVVLAALPEAARRHLEELMATGTYEYQSDFVRRYIHQGRAEGRVEGRAEGRVEGRADSVLAVLAVRGIAVPEEVRGRIAACADPEQLEVWLERAVTADDLAEVLEH